MKLGTWVAKVPGNTPLGSVMVTEALIEEKYVGFPGTLGMVVKIPKYESSLRVLNITLHPSLLLLPKHAQALL